MDVATSTLIDLDRLTLAAECLKTLAHAHRLRIVDMLLKDRYTVGELAEGCDIPSNIASGHLRLMQRCGFLSAERDGRNVYYAIAEPCLKKIMACNRERFAAADA
jgi:DNA-binding transcriptional ArsR family regulator